MRSSLIETSPATLEKATKVYEEVVRANSSQPDRTSFGRLPETFASDFLRLRENYLLILYRDSSSPAH